MINIDLDNLKVFMGKLTDFYEQLSAATKTIQNATTNATGFWNDEVFLRFSKELEDQISELMRVVSASQGYGEHLERLYAAGLNYLSYR